MANIMILTWLFPPSSGGVESYTYSLARGVSKKNKVLVFTTGKKYPGEDSEKFKIVRITEMYPYNRTKKECEKLSNKLEKELISHKIDLVHSHALVALPTNYSTAIIRTINKLNIPLIDHCHDAREKNLNKDLIKEDIKKIICVSEFVKKSLIKIRWNKEIIKRIYSGIDTDLFNPDKYHKTSSRKLFNLPLNKNMILFPSRAIRTTTGEFGEQKNFLTLLNSVENIKKEYGDNFFIAFPTEMGSKSSSNAKKTIRKLKEYLNKNKIEKNVIMIKKKVRYQDMPRLYSAADIVCTPSFNEAFGLIFVEAMLMKLPVIGAKSGAVPEIISNSSGYLINPKDSKKLSKILIKLLKDEKLRKKKGLAGRKIALNKFSFNRMINEIEQVYGEIVK